MGAVFYRYALVSQLLYNVLSQGTVSLTFSENPAIIGSQVAMTCLFEDTMQLAKVTVDAFNGTHGKGSVSCDSVKGANSTGTGVFAGRSFFGCSALEIQPGRVNVTVSMSPGLELEYTCSLWLNDHKQFYNATSNRTQLLLRVPLSKLNFIPATLDFNESESVSLACRAGEGRPAPAVQLTVRSDSRVLNSSEGCYSAELNGTVLWTWHNATIVCNATNHNVSRTSRIKVNHIAAHSVIPITVNTNSTDKVLDCSANITVFPSATYNWTFPAEIAANKLPSVNGSIIHVAKGMQGKYNCVATNIVTRKIVVVTYNVIRMTQDERLENARHWNNDSETHVYVIWAVVAVSITLVITIVTLIVMYKRGHFQKSESSEKPGDHAASQRVDGEEGNTIIMTDNSVYSAWVPPAEDGTEVSRNLDNSLPNVKGNTAAPREQKRKTVKPKIANGIRNPSRLLVAADGAAANIKHKILPTTVLLEFSHTLCSVDSILDKIGQVISSTSHPTFESVGLLLQTSTDGLVLSAVDRVVLNSKSITSKQSEKLRNFFTHLVEISLENKSRSSRVDVFNYGGSDSTKLSKELENLVKVNVTVSDDLFGMDSSKQKGRKCAAVGEDYFDCDRVTEIIYAEVQTGLGNPPRRERGTDDHVVYSSLAFRS